MARIVDGQAPDGTAAIGSTVTVEDSRGRAVERYQIVGPLEPGGAGRVTAGSPIGEALIGCAAGDSVSVALPSGAIREFAILAIEAPIPGFGG
jgi:transcription elongation factor GreA